MPGMTIEKAHRLLSEVGVSRLPGVYHSRSWGIRFGEDVLDALEIVAKESENDKARLCLHPSPKDLEQQMLVALTKKCIDQIHFHPDKGESVLWVRGVAEHRTFDMSGTVLKKTQLGPSDFRYVHTPPGVPHHVVVLSEVFIFWEFAKGPFGPNSTVPVHSLKEKKGD